MLARVGNPLGLFETLKVEAPRRYGRLARIPATRCFLMEQGPFT